MAERKQETAEGDENENPKHGRGEERDRCRPEQVELSGMQHQPVEQFVR